MTDIDLARKLVEFYRKFNEWPDYQARCLEKWRGLSEDRANVKGYALAVGMIEGEKK